MVWNICAMVDLPRARDRDLNPSLGPGLALASGRATNNNGGTWMAYYDRKLLQPGWAGEVSDQEASYIARELSRNALLRRRWYQGTRFSRKDVTPDFARALVAYWTERLTLRTRRRKEPRKTEEGLQPRKVVPAKATVESPGKTKSTGHVQAKTSQKTPKAKGLAHPVYSQSPKRGTPAPKSPGRQQSERPGGNGAVAQRPESRKKAAASTNGAGRRQPAPSRR